MALRDRNLAHRLFFALLVAMSVSALVITQAPPARASVAAYGFKAVKPLGQQVITPTVSTALTRPAGAKHAIISIRTAGVMMRDDGTAPTSTVGLYLAAGTVLQIENDPDWISAMRFINSSDGAATVYVSYYGDR